MKKTKIVLFTTSVVLILLCVGVNALFHGYFDHGQFDMKQVQWSSSKKVAMMVERTDNDALGGLTDFVLIGDHLFSPAEVRHAYHSDAVVFAAATHCLTLHWESPSGLVIACNGPYLDQASIDVNKRQSGEVAISYVNISPGTAQTVRPD
jgi:hypothetical protein